MHWATHLPLPTQQQACSQARGRLAFKVQSFPRQGCHVSLLFYFWVSIFLSVQ